MGLFFSFNFHGKNDRLRTVIWSDQEGYYVYLPAMFIYDGFARIPVKNCCRIKKTTGEVDTKYTYGVAVFELPFFLGAHAIAKSTYDEGHSEECHHANFKPNGFSHVYAYGIMIGAVFWLSLALFFLQKVLRRYVSVPVSILTCILIFFGTNLFYYTIGEAGMSHVYSFFLFSLILWALPAWLRQATWARTLLIGAALGLTVVIRPTNIIFAVVLLAWDVYSWKELQSRVKYLFRQWPRLILMAALAMIIAFPQMLYWHHIHGSWISYSYQEEGFIFWNKPKLFHVWFSYQNGLFMYSPIMLLAIVGLVRNLFQRKMNAPVILGLFLLSSYIFASWWAWWFGGAYGHRSFIEYFALLAIPMASAIDWIFKSRAKWPKFLLLFLGLWLILIQMKMTYMYAPPWDGDAWTWTRFLQTWKQAIRVWRGWS